MAQEKQNTEGTIKQRVFFQGTNFVKAAKLHRNNISKRKSHEPSRFDQSTRKKVLSSIGYTVARNFHFVFPKNLFREKCKTGKFCSF